MTTSGIVNNDHSTSSFQSFMGGMMAVPVRGILDLAMELIPLVRGVLYVTRFGKIRPNAVKLIIRYDHLLSLY